MFSWRLPENNRPLVMGIVNVTPDSFSDGGQHFGTEKAVAHGLELVRQGADILDVGGESTRPGSQAVPEDEELRRVVPVIEQLARNAGIPISVDTNKAAVARASLDAGATIINDVFALRQPGMGDVARDSGAGIILMHMQGTPADMQANPRYENVVEEIDQFFEERLRFCDSQGIARQRIALDPGIGFGKKAEHNIQILANLKHFRRFGLPICLGVSRKGIVGKLLGDRPVVRRLAGSLAVLCFAMAQEAVQIVRVHDVEETRDAVNLFAILGERANLGAPGKA